jgi:hypothetical protein
MLEKLFEIVSLKSPIPMSRWEANGNADYRNFCSLQRTIFQAYK